MPAIAPLPMLGSRLSGGLGLGVADETGSGSCVQDPEFGDDSGGLDGLFDNVEESKSDAYSNAVTGSVRMDKARPFNV